jgi:hypothetical protein
MTDTEIIAQMDAYMQGIEGYTNAGWYVGIAANPEARLFTDHSVYRDKGAWIYCPATSDTAARAVEDTYHAAGCDGGPGGGDFTTTFVYAYLKTRTTKE